MPATIMRPRHIWVRTLSRRATRGHVVIGGRLWPCALGRSGCTVFKREGDGATPVGQWPVRAILYRTRRNSQPATLLPKRPLRPSDGWCDDPADRNYNRIVRWPYPASAEHLWRTDPVYDCIVILNCNERPRRRGAGSAIFMHIARPGYTPTEGCIALSARDLRQVLRYVRPGSRLRL